MAIENLKQGIIKIATGAAVSAAATVGGCSAGGSQPTPTLVRAPSACNTEDSFHSSFVEFKGASPIPGEIYKSADGANILMKLNLKGGGTCFVRSTGAYVSASREPKGFRDLDVSELRGIEGVLEQAIIDPAFADPAYATLLDRVKAQLAPVDFSNFKGVFDNVQSELLSACEGKGMTLILNGDAGPVHVKITSKPDGLAIDKPRAPERAASPDEMTALKKWAKAEMINAVLTHGRASRELVLLNERLGN
jgi:hypothetical protein